MISEAEFAAVAEDILRGKQANFDRLYRLVEQQMSRRIRRLSYSYRKYESEYEVQEIIQLVQIRVFKTVDTQFLQRGDELNYDPQGFYYWLYAIATNMTHDYYRRKKVEDRPDHLDGAETDGEEDDGAWERAQFWIAEQETLTRDRREAAQDRLTGAFVSVLTSPSQPHIVLTWLAQSLSILTTSDRGRETLDIVAGFRDKPLNRIFDDVCACVERLRWLRLPPDVVSRMRERLARVGADGRPIGDTTYGEFFMRGDEDGRASMSDWFNRMNTRLRRATL